MNRNEQKEHRKERKSKKWKLPGTEMLKCLLSSDWNTSGQ